MKEQTRHELMLLVAVVWFVLVGILALLTSHGWWLEHLGLLWTVGTLAVAILTNWALSKL